jgi:CheY-like chemotaxis protein
LIADADADTRLLYREELFSGWDVVEAADGRDALVKALVRSPELVLTELRLPLMDGFALCEILRRDRTTADVPIMVVTSETRPTEVDRLVAAGADVVLPKPTSIELMRAEMLCLLRRSRTASARGERTRQHAARLLSKSAELLLQGMYAREQLSKTYRRTVTTLPPVRPPTLSCPLCERRLRYVSSYVAGVSPKHPEQWDIFECGTCGRFEYRQRTRSLRPLRNPKSRLFPR